MKEFTRLIDIIDMHVLPMKTKKDANKDIRNEYSLNKCVSIMIEESMNIVEMQKSEPLKDARKQSMPDERLAHHIL